MVAVSRLSMLSGHKENYSCQFDEFYPPPWRVSTRMLSNVSFDRDDSVLEPSAGKGDLIDFVFKKYKNSIVIVMILILMLLNQILIYVRS